MARWVVEAVTETGAPDGKPIEVNARSATEAGKKALKEPLISNLKKAGRLRAKAYEIPENGDSAEIFMLFQAVSE